MERERPLRVARHRRRDGEPDRARSQIGALVGHPRRERRRHAVRAEGKDLVVEAVLRPAGVEEGQVVGARLDRLLEGLAPVPVDAGDAFAIGERGDGRLAEGEPHALRPGVDVEGEPANILELAVGRAFVFQDHRPRDTPLAHRHQARRRGPHDRRGPLARERHGDGGVRADRHALDGGAGRRRRAGRRQHDARLARERGRDHEYRIACRIRDVELRWSLAVELQLDLPRRAGR